MALDQVTKAAVMRLLYHGQIAAVIPGFFDLVHFKNPGAAFSILSDGGPFKTVFLIASSSIALIVIGVLLKQSKDLLFTFALSLIAGGAIGNLVDRIRFGSVVDFLYFHLGPYYWPAFNVADSAITIGVILAVIIFYFRQRRH